MNAQTIEEREAYARETVAQFSQEIWQSRCWQISQMLIGADISHFLMTAGRHEPFGEEWLSQGLESQQWLLMARAGLGLVTLPADAEAAEMLRGEIYEICQGLAEWLFATPGQSVYTIPDSWAEHPVGQLWHLAMVWLARDELITIAEAAKFAGVTTQAIHQRIAHGKLRAYIDPSAPAHQGRRLVRRQDVVASKDRGDG